MAKLATDLQSGAAQSPPAAVTESTLNVEPPTATRPASVVETDMPQVSFRMHLYHLPFEIINTILPVAKPPTPRPYAYPYANHRRTIRIIEHR